MFAWFFRRFGWLYFIVAALVAWSRVYVGDHYPSDVLAAAAIGTVVGLLGMKFLEWLWRTYAPRFARSVWLTHSSLAPADRDRDEDVTTKDKQLQSRE